MNKANSIPFGGRYISEADIQAVIDLVSLDFLIRVPVLFKFEKAVATYCHFGQGLAAANNKVAHQMFYLLLQFGRCLKKTINLFFGFGVLNES